MIGDTAALPGSVSDGDAKQQYPNGWRAPKPYLRWVQFFTKWGIPLWLMHFIGVSELAGAIVLLVPRARPAAAFALFLMMIGGLVTHLTHEYALAFMPVIYGTGLYFRWKDAVSPLSVREPLHAASLVEPHGRLTWIASAGLPPNLDVRFDNRGRFRS